MTWMWISMIVILVGAQLNAEIERQNGSGPMGHSEDPLKDSDNLPKARAIGFRTERSRAIGQSPTEPNVTRTSFLPSVHSSL